ncbi:MAG: acyl-CoA thioesterase [Bacteroidales bacterium]|nr:acyl-CoA thioesterase [Bacteroidales bacterium]
MKSTYAQHLVRGADLNHHETFYAGRCAEWLIESSYFAIAQYLDTKNVVLLVQHGINFRFPIALGDIITFESKIVAAGRSTVTVYTKVYKSNDPDTISAYGFSTFSNLDHNHTSRAHGLVIKPETAEEAALQQEASELVMESLKHASRNRRF